MIFGKRQSDEELIPEIESGIKGISGYFARSEPPDLLKRYLKGSGIYKKLGKLEDIGAKSRLISELKKSISDSGYDVEEFEIPEA